MCLGIPGKVISIDGEDSLRLGRVSFSGIEREVGLAFVPEVKLGDYVIVHVGYAISILDPDAARRTLELLDEIENVESKAEGGGPYEVRR